MMLRYHGSTTLCRVNKSRHCKSYAVIIGHKIFSGNAKNNSTSMFYWQCNESCFFWYKLINIGVAKHKSQLNSAPLARRLQEHILSFYEPSSNLTLIQMLEFYYWFQWCTYSQQSTIQGCESADILVPSCVESDSDRKDHFLVSRLFLTPYLLHLGTLTLEHQARTSCRQEIVGNVYSFL